MNNMYHHWGFTLITGTYSEGNRKGIMWSDITQEYDTLLDLLDSISNVNLNTDSFKTADDRPVPPDVQVTALRNLILSMSVVRLLPTRRSYTLETIHGLRYETIRTDRYVIVHHYVTEKAEPSCQERTDHANLRLERIKATKNSLAAMTFDDRLKIQSFA